MRRTKFKGKKKDYYKGEKIALYRHFGVNSKTKDIPLNVPFRICKPIMGKENGRYLWIKFGGRKRKVLQAEIVFLK